MLGRSINIYLGSTPGQETASGIVIRYHLDHKKNSFFYFDEKKGMDTYRSSINNRPIRYVNIRYLFSCLTSVSPSSFLYNIFVFFISLLAELTVGLRGLCR